MHHSWKHHHNIWWPSHFTSVPATALSFRQDLCSLNIQTAFTPHSVNCTASKGHSNSFLSVTSNTAHAKDVPMQLPQCLSPSSFPPYFPFTFRNSTTSHHKWPCNRRSWKSSVPKDALPYSRCHSLSQTKFLNLRLIYKQKFLELQKCHPFFGS